MNYAATKYAATQEAAPQAQAYAHRAPNDTSITVVVGTTTLAVVSDGHATEWFAVEGVGSDEGVSDLQRAAFDFALAAAELSLRAMEAGIPNAFGEA